MVPWENPASIHLQVTLADDDGEVTIASATGRTGEPTRHARGGVRRLLRSRPAPVDVPALRDRCPAQAEPGRIYPDLAAAGLDYGPAFRTLRELRVGQGEVLAAYHHTADSAGYEIHPALLDGALQAGLPLMAGVLAGRRHAYLPGAIDAVRVWQAPPPQGLVHLRERGRTSTEVCWDITVTDTGGTVMAELEGCRLRRFDGLRTTSLTRSTTVMRAAPHPGVPAAPSPCPALPSSSPRQAPHRRTARGLAPDGLRAGAPPAEGGVGCRFRHHRAGPAARGRGLLRSGGAHRRPATAPPAPVRAPAAPPGTPRPRRTPGGRPVEADRTGVPAGGDRPAGGAGPPRLRGRGHPGLDPPPDHGQNAP
ncbi:polyketide synthase dehydratase domain-containing protein [Streptomyces stramineus]